MTITPNEYSSGGHCCVCTGVCGHTGGPYFCDIHNPNQRIPILPALPPEIEIKPLFDDRKLRKSIDDLTKSVKELITLLKKKL